MIDITKLTDADVGRGVVYAPKREQGAITSWNEDYVFVRYHATGGSQATRPEDLDWVGGKAT